MPASWMWPSPSAEAAPLEGPTRGHVYQKVRVRARRTATLKMLLDTGATFSVLPRKVARALGITRPRRIVTVRLADGKGIRMGADVAVIRIGNREAPATILVGRAEEPLRCGGA